MGRRPDDPHDRQSEIDEILVSTADHPAGEVLHLLREVGIGPEELGITDDPKQASNRIAGLRYKAKTKLRPSMKELAAEADKAHVEVERAREKVDRARAKVAQEQEALAEARARLDDVLQRMGEAHESLRGGTGS